MQIVKEVRIIHCSDGRIKKEYLLFGPVSREFTDTLKPFGEVRIIEGQKKPFFTFLIRGCLNIKGFIGDTTLEAWYVPNFIDDGERFLHAVVASSERPREDLEDLHRQLLASVQAGPA